jgi:hypothetical protein
MNLQEIAKSYVFLGDKRLPFETYGVFKIRIKIERLLYNYLIECGNPVNLNHVPEHQVQACLKFLVANQSNKNNVEKP